jgi:hypothetical protein
VTPEADVGDTSIELDSPSDDFSVDAIPQTVLNVANFTFIQNSGTDEVINIRGGAQLNLANGIIDSQGAECIAFTEQASIDGGSSFNSIVGDCPDPAVTTDASQADAQAVLDAGSNLDLDVDVTFTNAFFFDASGTAAFDVTTLSGFFEDTDFLGAIETADSTRFVGWTCDSDTIDFGSGSRCDSLPIRPGEG